MKNSTASNLNFSPLKEHNLLKVFLLFCLHKLLCDLFQNKRQIYQPHFSMEYHAMDSKVIQTLIQSILETELYTLEGIAYYTRLPFDIIYDAACGISNHCSITFWSRIIDLYLKINPDITKILIKKLLEINEKYADGFSLLLSAE